MSLEEWPHTRTLEETAVSAMAVLGFEALYHTDDDTYSDDDRDECSTTSASNALFFPGEQDTIRSSKHVGRERKIANSGCEEKTTSREEADASKRTVAWFHQQRVQKNKTGKVEIIMAVEDEMAVSTPSKRMATRTAKIAPAKIAPNPEKKSPKYIQKQNPDPSLHAILPRRRTITKKMKGWLLKGASVSDSPKTFEDKASVDSPEDEIATDSGKTHRLTIVSYIEYCLWCSFHVPMLSNQL